MEYFLAGLGTGLTISLCTIAFFAIQGWYEEKKGKRQ